MTFYANGKLLLTAEYFVLDGAKALALPTKLGQSLTISKNKKPNFAFDSEWRSMDESDNEWYACGFDSDNFTTAWESGEEVGERLMSVLKTAKSLGGKNFKRAVILETALTFPRNWGLGTSSTLIYNLATYLKINPYLLLEKTFGGSGYDIACAGAKQPIFFEKKNNKPLVSVADFKPTFKDNLYFVFLNQKQNSREGIAHYREKSQKLPPQYFDDILALTNSFCEISDLRDFEKSIVEHENLVASVIELPRAKSLYFNDFWGEIKSLGAWGGDFILATSDRPYQETNQYFAERGFTTCIKYDDLIL